MEIWRISSLLVDTEKCGEEVFEGSQTHAF